MNILAHVAALPRASREIDGKGRTVRELLSNRKYLIDYYQREYKWQHKQVAELIKDLAAKFLDSYDEGDERTHLELACDRLLNDAVRNVSSDAGHSRQERA